MAKPSTMKVLAKLDRIAAWTLLVVVILFFFSGYGMLKYLMDVELAKFIHDKVLPVPALIAFVIHSTYAVHLSLKRWKMWNKRTLFILFGFFAAILVYFVLVHYGVIQGKPPVKTLDLDL